MRRALLRDASATMTTFNRILPDVTPPKEVRANARHNPFEVCGLTVAGTRTCARLRSKDKPPGPKRETPAAHGVRRVGCGGERRPEARQGGAFRRAGVVVVADVGTDVVRGHLVFPADGRSAPSAPLSLAVHATPDSFGIKTLNTASPHLNGLPTVRQITPRPPRHRDERRT